MTEEEFDQVYDVKNAAEEAISTAVRAILDVEKLTPEQRELVITLLHENYRFWDLQ